LVFWALRSQAKLDLLHRLDADAYSSKEVVVLTLPVSLPYPIHDPTYERANGEIEYKGEFYQLVKQKVENDTLFMVCVKDHDQKRLNEAINEYTDLTNNLPAGSKRAMDLLGKLFKDFTSIDSFMPSFAPNLSDGILFPFTSSLIIQLPLSVESPPPEFLLS
jgi:hypothetical protein